MKSVRDAEIFTQSVRFRHFCLSTPISQSVGAHHQICRNASRLAGNFLTSGRKFLMPEIPASAHLASPGRNESTMVPINRTNEQTSEHRENDRRAAIALRTRSRILISRQNSNFLARAGRPSLSVARGGVWHNFSGPSSSNLHASLPSQSPHCRHLNWAQRCSQRPPRPGKKTRYRPTPKLKGGDILVAALVSCAEH